MNNKLNPMYQIRRVYEWTLHWAEHKRSVYALSVIAFTESIFFPIPADVLLLVMSTARPKRALFYGFVCSVASVMGAVLGYILGYYAWQAVEAFFFTYVFSEAIFQKVGLLYEQNAFWSVFTAAFTPIPFKVFTVAAGAFEITFLPFFLAAAVGRPLRFMMVSVLFYFFGASIKDLIERYFNLVTIVFTVLLVGGFFAIKWMG